MRLRAWPDSFCYIVVRVFESILHIVHSRPQSPPHVPYSCKVLVQEKGALLTHYCPCEAIFKCPKDLWVL